MCPLPHRERGVILTIFLHVSDRWKEHTYWKMSPGTSKNLLLLFLFLVSFDLLKVPCLMFDYRLSLRLRTTFSPLYLSRLATESLPIFVAFYYLVIILVQIHTIKVCTVLSLGRQPREISFLSSASVTLFFSTAFPLFFSTICPQDTHFSTGAQTLIELSYSNFSLTI